MSLPAEAVQKLHMALPASRVHKRVGGGGKSLDYIAAHDAIRTANAIFGFGGWGSVVTDLTCVGQEQVVSKDGNKKGYRVGYRCTVLLSVAGCEPTSGVGYGDAMEYNDSSITPHENAAKEAESDALKRALKNYGDQFGLILYAGQGDERQRVEREAAIRRERALKDRADQPGSGRDGGLASAALPTTSAGEPERLEPAAVESRGTASMTAPVSARNDEAPSPADTTPEGDGAVTPVAAHDSSPAASGEPGGSPATSGPQFRAPASVPAQKPPTPKTKTLLNILVDRCTSVGRIAKADLWPLTGHEPADGEADHFSPLRDRLTMHEASVLIEHLTAVEEFAVADGLLEPRKKAA